MAIQGEKPDSAFYSTTLNSRISGYDRLSERITYALGYPLVNVEVHKNQLYENIAIACEMYTKFAGYTTEYLVFDSNIYEKGKGIRLDKLFTNTPDLCAHYTSVNVNLEELVPTTLTTRISADSATGVNAGYQEVYQINVADEELDPTEFVIKFIDKDSSHTAVRKVLVTVQHLTGAPGTSTVDYTEHSILYTSDDDLGTFALQLSGANEEIVQFMVEPNHDITTGLMDVIITSTDRLEKTRLVNLSGLAFGAYDALVNNYRKVIDIFNFEEGSTSGINTLFTIEQTLAQQTYMSYSMGNYGFDLVSWYIVREWLDTREKMLTQRRSYEFNEHTQYLRFYPEPKSERFYGVLGVYLEKPIEWLVHEAWIYQYALALTKISVGRVRTKYAGTTLFGGGSLDTEILAEGKEEKKELEERLYEGAPGFGDADPPMFFIG